MLWVDIGNIAYIIFENNQEENEIIKFRNFLRIKKCRNTP